mgnify:CR=1 FL=1
MSSIEKSVIRYALDFLMQNHDEDDLTSISQNANYFPFEEDTLRKKIQNIKEELV